MNWLKWHCGTVADPKFISLAKKTGQPKHAIIAVWAMLLETAGNAVKRGDVSSVDVDDFSACLDIEANIVQSIIDAMEQKGMIVAGQLAAWEKRQITATSTERVRKFRDKSRPDETHETVSETRETHETTDKIREDKKIKNATEPVTVDFPDWLPKQSFEAFSEMRKKIRAPLTGRAVVLLFKELDRLRRAGNDPAAVLDRSTQNAWRGIFEIPTDQRKGVQNAADPLKGWRDAAATWRSNPAQWPSSWGPPPDSPQTKCPAEILSELGIRRAA